MDEKKIAHTVKNTDMDNADLHLFPVVSYTDNYTVV